MGYQIKCTRKKKFLKSRFFSSIYGSFFFFHIWKIFEFYSRIAYSRIFTRKFSYYLFCVYLRREGLPYMGQLTRCTRNFQKNDKKSFQSKSRILNFHIQNIFLPYMEVFSKYGSFFLYMEESSIYGSFFSSIYGSFFYI